MGWVVLVKRWSDGLGRAAVRWRREGEGGWLVADGLTWCCSCMPWWSTSPWSWQRKL
jgi:hypothetical protein